MGKAAAQGHNFVTAHMWIQRATARQFQRYVCIGGMGFDVYTARGNGREGDDRKTLGGVGHADLPPQVNLGWIDEEEHGQFGRGR